MDDSSSRDRLIRAASGLFRRRGYAGVGVSEILTVAELPKGSLYHHFPGGKRELAEAATLWASGAI
ncbi:MAG: TetR family transcriptional regulator, partial [Pseudodonghicola sp.]